MSPAGQAALNRRNDQRTQKRTGLATPSTKSCQRPHICTMSAASHSFGTEFTTGHRGLLSCLVRLRVFAHICLHVLRAPPVRSFYCCVTGAGLAVGAGTGAAETAERPLTETEVRVKTPDGNCDAAFIHPTTGSFPGVLVWPDAASTWTPLAEQLAQHLRGFSLYGSLPNRTDAAPPPFQRAAGTLALEVSRLPGWVGLAAFAADVADMFSGPGVPGPGNFTPGPFSQMT
jgi:hypothetical protein